MLKGLLVDLEPINGDWPDKMYHHWNNSSRLWATMGENEPISRAAIDRIIEERQGARERGYTGVHFMMRARDGNIIGSIGLNWVDLWNRYAFMGAWIGEKEYWGGGHGTDGLLLVCEYAYDWLDVRRLSLGTMSTNERAQRNVEKCGFHLEARQRQSGWVNGARVDELVYGMLREEWRGRAQLVKELGLVERAVQRYGDAALQNGTDSAS